MRINGTAQTTDDAILRAGSAVRGGPPSLGLIIAVRAGFRLCPKAFIRSELWNPMKQVDRSALPSYTTMLTDHVADLSETESNRQSYHYGRSRLILRIYAFDARSNTAV